MASLNQCNFIGNLGRDPELSNLPGGDAVTRFSIACTETWVDKATNSRKESVEWVNIVIFGRLAEVAAKYLVKGSQVFVSGKLKTRKWQDKTTGQDRYITEVVCYEMKMLGAKPDSGSSQQPAPRTAPASNQKTRPVPNDDIPF